jgi:hypothetical protein
MNLSKNRDHLPIQHEVTGSILYVYCAVGTVFSIINLVFSDFNCGLCCNRTNCVRVFQWRNAFPSLINCRKKEIIRLKTAVQYRASAVVCTIARPHIRPSGCLQIGDSISIFRACALGKRVTPRVPNTLSRPRPGGGGEISVWYFTSGNALAIYQQLWPLIIQVRWHNLKKQGNISVL